jgi:hypothetical protein
MNNEVIERRKRWVASLRSGEFKQGTGCLKDNNDKYCCLGVACEIYRRETSDGEWLPLANNYEFKSHVDEFDTVILTPAVVEYFGLKCENPKIKNSLRYTLAELNDKGFSFEQIANVIEEYL